MKCKSLLITVHRGDHQIICNVYFFKKVDNGCSLPATRHGQAAEANEFNTELEDIPSRTENTTDEVPTTRPEVDQALQSATTVCRGPKPWKT